MCRSTYNIQQNHTFVVHARDTAYKYCTAEANYVSIQINVFIPETKALVFNDRCKMENVIRLIPAKLKRRHLSFLGFPSGTGGIEQGCQGVHTQYKHRDGDNSRTRHSWGFLYK